MDAWLGRQARGHEDLDVAVFNDDAGVLFEHLAGWQLVVDHPWLGRLDG